MRDFNRYLRMAVASSYQDGTVKEVERLAGGYAIPPEARPILAQLVRVVMLSDYTKPDTKEYLSTPRGMRTIYHGKGVASNPHTSRSRIQYDLTKLKTALTISFFDRLMEGGDLTEQAEAVERLERKARGRSLLEGYQFDLPSPTGELEAIDRDTLNKLMTLTRAFGSARVAYDRSKFTPDMINFLNYLENHREQLSQENQATYQYLRRYMK